MLKIEALSYFSEIDGNERLESYYFYCISDIEQCNQMFDLNVLHRAVRHFDKSLTQKIFIVDVTLR